MKIPKEFEHLATQNQIDDWYDDAASNCFERMEEPTEEDVKTWAEFCVIERLKQLAWKHERDSKK